MMLHFTSTTLIEYLEQVFPQIKGEFTVLELAERQSKVKLNVQEKHLRQHFLLRLLLGKTHSQILAHH